MIGRNGIGAWAAASLVLHALVMFALARPLPPPSALAAAPLRVRLSNHSAETKARVAPVAKTSRTAQRRAVPPVQPNRPARRLEPAAAQTAALTPRAPSPDVADAQNLPARTEPATAPAEAIRAMEQRLRTAQQERARSKLSRLLHSAIAAQQRYPLSARRLRREGTARVGFRLSPDGRIGRLELTQSTGDEVLDRAALSAVTAIQPFAAAAHYLASAEEFQVDIIFRLGN